MYYSQSECTGHPCGVSRALLGIATKLPCKVGGPKCKRERRATRRTGAAAPVKQPYRLSQLSFEDATEHMAAGVAFGAAASLSHSAGLRSLPCASPSCYQGSLVPIRRAKRTSPADMAAPTPAKKRMPTLATPAEVPPERLIEAANPPVNKAPKAINRRMENRPRCRT